MSSSVGPNLEVVLVSRNNESDAQGNAITSDYRLRLALARGESSSISRTISTAPSSAWPGAPSTSTDDYSKPMPIDHTDKVRSLSGFSPFGSGETNEFATWNMGRETVLSSRSLREGCEDDLRSFAERSDHTEGFMLTTPISDGFSGISAAFLEILRDDFHKSSVFTTAMISDAVEWKRDDTERSKKQRLLNLAFGLPHLEEFSSLLLPIQPPAAWEDNAPWTKFLRQDLSRRDSHKQVLTSHLQSANTELREPDGLNQIVAQLNWRGNNKICHLVGATPMLPPEHLTGTTGPTKLKETLKDFSVLPPSEGKAKGKARRASTPFAQYSVVRGFEFEETQQLGPIFEQSVLPLKEPLAQWVSLPDPYPILPGSLPIYRSLLPNGRPLVITPPLPHDPYSPAGLFGIPDPLFPTSDSYVVQPSSIPLMTTLSTTPDSKYLLRYVVGEMMEMMRVRDPVVKEYEEGEYSLGREGLLDARERLETILSELGDDDEDDDEMEGKDEDENWDDTEPKEEDDEDWDM